MKVNREKLLESLGKVIPVVVTGGFIPDYSYIKFDGNRIQATDGVVVINTTCSEDLHLKCGVPGKSLFSLIESLREEEIELEHASNVLKVKTNKVEGTFTILEEVNFVDIPLDKAEKLEISSKEELDNLIDGLALCRFSVSRDESIGPMCGVRLEKNVVVSSDRYRISKYVLDEEVLLCGRTLPIKLVNLLVKNKESVKEICYISDESFIVLLDDEKTVISSSLLTGEFPNLLQYFPTSKDSSEIVFEESIGSALDRHILFLREVDSLDKEIEISVEKKEAVLSSTNPEYGKLTERVDLVGSSVKTSFLVNPHFLKGIVDDKGTLRYFTKEELVLVEKGKFQSLIQTRK